MPRKSAENIEEVEEKTSPSQEEKKETSEVDKLSEMLASVLEYISDDEIEEIDIDYILDKTAGLRDWWNQYKEKNRKHIEEEIRESLGELSLEELEKIREQIKETKK
ncbi:MAG TPA: hypothetical protein VNR61_03750 [Niallia sp.]|nr:hypothetical protein [Niallia sp.]